MADWYVRSAAGGTGSGANWANAKTTLAAAFSAGAAGDRFFVSDDHAESSASTITLTCPGTAASPCQILCVNHSGSVPPVSADLRTTATITTTAGAANINLTGYGYAYGISLIAGSGVVSSSNFLNIGNSGTLGFVLDTCTLYAANTNNGVVAFGAGNGNPYKCVLSNSTIKHGNVNPVTVSGPVEWFGGKVDVTVATPTTLFSPSGFCPYVKVFGVDLSGLGSGKSLVLMSNGEPADFYFEDCKLSALVTIGSGSVVGTGGTRVRVVNCDSGATNYHYFKQTYEGTIIQETTVVKSGGATDGTTPVSRKMVSTANSKFYSPLRSDPIAFWNDSTTAVTITVPVITDNVTLQNVDAWIEVEYLGTSGFPQAVFDKSSRASDALASGTNQPTDSTSTWTTTGLTTPVKQSLTATITPAMKGPMMVRVMLAKPSTTLWFDPQVI